MNAKLLSLPVRFRLETRLDEIWTLLVFVCLDLFQCWRSSSEIPLFVVAFAIASHRFACAKFFRALGEEHQAWRLRSHHLVETPLRWLEIAGSLAVAVFLVWFLGVV